MTVRLITIGFLLFIAHFCKGVGDDLQFHYPDTVFATWDNQRFWDPDRSWENKYATDEAGELIRPLKERFLGSSTVVVAVTDAWHLLQAVQYALIRIALVLLIVPVQLPRRRWYLPITIYVGVWIIQAAGFHLGYTVL